MAESTVTVTAPELTSEQVQTILVRPLEEASVFLAAGPRVFDTNGSQVRIPKLGGPTDPSWHGENEQIDEVDPDFDEVVLLPSTMKSVKTLTRFSNELARQSVVNLDAALRARLVTDVAAKIDTQLLSADGDGTATPKGLFAYTGVQTVAVGGALDLDDLLDAWGLALAANVNMAALRWLLTPREFVKLRKLKDGDGRFMLQPDPTLDGVFRLFGAPSSSPAGCPTPPAAPPPPGPPWWTSHRSPWPATWPPASGLDQTYGDFDQMALGVVARYDAAPLNPEAIVTLTGITI